MTYMMWALAILVALLGHTAVWISFWNQTQGRSLPRWIDRVLSSVAKVACGGLPLAISWQVYYGNETSTYFGSWAYIIGCFVIGIVGIPIAWYRRRTNRDSAIVDKRSNTVEVPEAKRASLEAARGLTKILLHVPANQSFELECSEKDLLISRLPSELEDLTIAHLSDLHFTGKVARPFFNRAIDLVNDMEADFVAITGDLVDDPRYMSWIPVTLGRLRAKYGVYVILGNHDCKLPIAKLRLLLSEVGLFSLSGRLHQETVRGVDVILASNELPWITPTSDMSLCADRVDGEQLRVLLAHTPDMLPWAQRFDFDLMLAGHTHGGQFQLPGFGPIVCPCRLPLDYAAGTFYAEPTVMHVSRGLSGEVPLRLNCRPEITKLTLKPPTHVEAQEFEAATCRVSDENPTDPNPQTCQ